MGEPKPCPCCGSDPNFVDNGPYRDDSIECTQCDLTMPSHTLMCGATLERWNRRHNERTPAEEAVLRAAVACRRAGSNNWAAWMDLANAVDALLRENPAWGKEEGGG